MAKRTSRGRQKVEMKKMQNEDQLQVTFSRRRIGLIKMANEMCILTGAQVALVVFSPSDRVYPFGSPDVKPVIDRYEGQSPQPLNSHDMLVQSRRQANQLKLNSDLSLLENQLEALKKRGKLLDQMIEERKSEYWLDALIQEHDLNKLEDLLKAMKALHEDVTKEMHTMLTHLSQENNSVDFIRNATTDLIHNAADLSGIHGVSTPIMGRRSFNQMAPFDSRSPATVGFYQNAAVPSMIDGVSSLNVGESGSNGLAHIDSGEPGNAGVVQRAGSRRINGGSEMISGASSSNPMAPRFQGLDMSQLFNHGFRS